jgi:hypothetical protein
MIDFDEVRNEDEVKEEDEEDDETDEEKNQDDDVGVTVGRHESDFI